MSHKLHIRLAGSPSHATEFAASIECLSQECLQLEEPCDTKTELYDEGLAAFLEGCKLPGGSIHLLSLTMADERHDGEPGGFSATLAPVKEGK